ncbi:MAG: translation initiation factor IF-2, partial [Bacteroidaceae bacterium]
NAQTKVEVEKKQTVKSVIEQDKGEKAPVKQTIVEPEDKIFSLHADKERPQLKVLRTIDLSAINQNTRPKRKSKEERKKERDDKEKLRQEQRKQMKSSIMKEIHKDNPNRPAGEHKRRTRINNEKVDVSREKGTNPPSTTNRNNRRPNTGTRPTTGTGTGYRSNSGAGTGTGTGTSTSTRPSTSSNTRPSASSRFANSRFGPKKEVSEEDVAKKVKETLARLTNKTRGKGAKHRKDKRQEAFNRARKRADNEAEDNKSIKLTEFVTVSELASMMDVGATEVIGTCMSIGMMVSINQRLDAETIKMVAEEFGFQTEFVSAKIASAVVEEEDKEEDLATRAPIVTVMGHVDHGKTSLLDYVRNANVIAGEAGGITQHIGAYNVTLKNGRKITFLDTPGHEAFTAMRARGTKATDIVIIIIAADDNVMPQTKEAINHAQAAGVPIVFAINKIDNPNANPDRIKTELSTLNYLVEEWGGKYQSQDISAKKGDGVAELLDKVLLEADMLDLKANSNRQATGTVIESTLDKGRGYIATMLVSNGTLKVGDNVLAGTNYGRIKAMYNERNQRIESAGPSEPVLILGLDGAPTAGDTFHVFDTEQEARDIANQREQLAREQGIRTQKNLTLDEIGRRIALGTFQELNLIVKGDVDGSIEALSDALIKISTEHIQINVIHKGVGQISESDVTLAAASDAIIIGFQVRPSTAAKKYAEQEGVDIRMYSVIYAAIEEVKAAMEGMLAPVIQEVVTSTIEVREVFNITNVGVVAGAMVKEGKVKRSDKARLVREGIVVFSGKIKALKRFKDDVKEVANNYECGISLINCSDIKVDDVIETYEEIEVKATL